MKKTRKGPLYVQGYKITDHFLDQLRDRHIPLDWLVDALTQGLRRQKLHEGDPQTHRVLPVLRNGGEGGGCSLVVAISPEGYVTTAWVEDAHGNLVELTPRNTVKRCA